MPLSSLPNAAPERRTLWTASVVVLGGAAACWLLWRSGAPGHARVAYALVHLPAALLSIALVLAAAAILYPRLLAAFLQTDPDPPAARIFPPLIIAGVFAIFWIPAWLAGGLVEDDWRLVAAAANRHILQHHPALILQALDSVDGNYRPLGTVLYFAALYPVFGSHADHIYTFGPLLFVFLAALVLFALARELGFNSRLATVAAVLFLSRGMLYTVVTWASALGDALAIFFCGLTALALLRALRLRGWRAAAMHTAAWFSFLLGTLSKQSAFAAALIVALILFLRPGQLPPLPLRARLRAASLGLVIYGATAALVFEHAKHLAQFLSPYPIGFTLGGVFRTLNYLTWYLAVIQFPNRLSALDPVLAILGLLLLLALAFAARRSPPDPAQASTGIFAALAALASLSLFVLLPTRAAPYYGCMAAFWISLGLALLLIPSGTTPARSRTACAVFVFLVLSGFAEIRLAQTGLIPSGGYFWGTFGMDLARDFRTYLDRQLDAAPATRTVIFRDCNDRADYPAMAMLDSPSVGRILVIPPGGPAYGNNNFGLRPPDNVPALTDPYGYLWTFPIDPATTASLTAAPATLEIPCRAGYLPE